MRLQVQQQSSPQVLWNSAKNLDFIQCFRKPLYEGKPRNDPIPFACCKDHFVSYEELGKSTMSYFRTENSVWKSDLTHLPLYYGTSS